MNSLSLLIKVKGNWEFSLLLSETTKDDRFVGEVATLHVSVDGFLSKERTITVAFLPTQAVTLEPIISVLLLQFGELFELR